MRFSIQITEQIEVNVLTAAFSQHTIFTSRVHFFHVENHPQIQNLNIAKSAVFQLLHYYIETLLNSETCFLIRPQNRNANKKSPYRSKYSNMNVTRIVASDHLPRHHQSHHSLGIGDSFPVTSKQCEIDRKYQY